MDADEQLVLEADAVFIGVFTCIPFTEELGYVFFKMWPPENSLEELGMFWGVQIKQQTIPAHIIKSSEEEGSHLSVPAAGGMRKQQLKLQQRWSSSRGKNTWGGGSIWVMSHRRVVAGDELLFAYDLAWCVPRNGSLAGLGHQHAEHLRMSEGLLQSRAPRCGSSLFHVLISEHKYVTNKMLMNSSHCPPSFHIRTYKQFTTHTQTYCPGIIRTRQRLGGRNHCLRIQLLSSPVLPVPAWRVDGMLIILSICHMQAVSLLQAVWGVLWVRKSKWLIIWEKNARAPNTPLLFQIWSMQKQTHLKLVAFLLAMNRSWGANSLGAKVGPPPAF